MMPEAMFRAGDLVRRNSSPDMVGVIRDVEWDEQICEWFYRVRFSTVTRGVREADLERLPDDPDPWGDVASGRFAMALPFRTRLTYERLRKPPSRIAASFGSARAAFYPYQFKPLLKFLENERQRLLIADDVGLGKTIEAGYILRESRARHGLDRVLIVAPARLQSKWKSELERRFDEMFEVVRAQDLIRLRSRLERNQDLESFRWITSYEAARDRRVVSLLEEFEPALDLVIVDEAHRLRNTGTAQHAMGVALGVCADAMVFLTATPVQTGLENLFNLLRLLDPDEFPDYSVFREQTEANRAIVRLANAIRSESTTAGDLRPLIAELRAHRLTAELARSEYFSVIAEQAERVGTLRRPERIALQRDVAELSLTSHIISRTRKLDVMPDRPERKAKSLSITLTPSEMSFYTSVADLCRNLRSDLTDWGLAMATLMAYRYTASCIPAARELFRERALANNAASVLEHESETGEFFSDSPAVGIESLGRGLAAIAAATPVGDDSKFDRFAAALQEIWRDDEQARRPYRKVIVFSYFKRTLRYLSERLDALRVTHRRIDGDVSIPDREARIDEFATSESIRVLLSSEVGAEGLDLQFASVIVNYDLPWNPMVVEQRIGRVDRIGQMSPTITIVNLVADGTIEKRILLRLYDRIGIFEETIGEIDPILGEEIEKLTEEALSGTLSEEEQRRRVDRTADAVLQQELQARQLGSDADALMAADQAFLDEIESMIGKRRVPLPAELFEFVSGHLVRQHPGSTFPPSSIAESREARLPMSVAQELRAIPDADSETVRVARKVEAGPFMVTFNQQAALTHARAELVHARHPLVRLAFHAHHRLGASARAFALRLDRGAPAGDGLYLFAIWLYDLQGIRARTEMVPFFLRIGTNEVISDAAAESLYLRMLETSSSLDPFPALDGREVARCHSALRAAARDSRQALYARELALNEARHLRRKTTLEATHLARVKSAQARLKNLRSKAAAPFALRMAERKLEVAEARYQAAMADLGGLQAFAIEDEEVAIGIVAIQDGVS